MKSKAQLNFSHPGPVFKGTLIPEQIFSESALTCERENDMTILSGCRYSDDDSELNDCHVANESVPTVLHRALIVDQSDVAPAILSNKLDHFGELLNFPSQVESSTDLLDAPSRESLEGDHLRSDLHSAPLCTKTHEVNSVDYPSTKNSSPLAIDEDKLSVLLETKPLKQKHDQGHSASGFLISKTSKVPGINGNAARDNSKCLLPSKCDTCTSCHKLHRRRSRRHRVVKDTCFLSSSSSSLSAMSFCSSSPTRALYQETTLFSKATSPINRATLAESIVGSIIYLLPQRKQARDSTCHGQKNHVPSTMKPPFAPRRTIDTRSTRRVLSNKSDDDSSCSTLSLAEDDADEYRKFDMANDFDVYNDGTFSSKSHLRDTFRRHNPRLTYLRPSMDRTLLHGCAPSRSDARTTSTTTNTSRWSLYSRVDVSPRHPQRCLSPKSL